MDKEYTYKEFLAIAKRSRQTVSTWTNRGLLPVRKFGGRRYFLQEDIDLLNGIKEKMTENNNNKGNYDILFDKKRTS